MGRRKVVVETGLDELAFTRIGVLNRHARTRFVEEREQPTVAVMGVVSAEGWTDLLVKARLRRFADVCRRLPYTPDLWPQGHKSCMPTPVREPWKDQPADKGVRRLPVTLDELGMFNAMVKAISPLIKVTDDSDWQLLWGLAGRQKGTEVAVAIKQDERTARRWMVSFAKRLAKEWNRIALAIEEADIVMARKMIHRKIDGPPQ